MKHPLIVFLSLIIVLSCSDKKNQEDNRSVTELDGLNVPAGFTIEKIVPQDLISYPMFGIFDDQGRMFVFESDGSTPATTEDMLKQPVYRVRLLQDTDSNGSFDKSTIFADSLTIPKAGVFYKGSLYLTAAPDLLRITDTDSDGIGDKKEVLQTGWKLNHNAAVLGGPFMGPDGWMYLTDARRGFNITNKEGKHFEGKGARIWRCRPDGSGLEPILGGGYDNAIELVFMPGGETIGTMTYFLDPQGGQRDALMHWLEGGVYPKPHAVIQEDKLKLTGELMPVMTKLSRIAPSGLMKYKGNAWGEEFNGNLFSAEFNTGRIMRSVIRPDGATFKTSDTAFVAATREDVHPTDVFQDADGSLIVINTGGWFIAGCPLSRVAKLDVPGGIYRIRKSRAKKIDDPWGRSINMDRLSADGVSKYVGDDRSFVHDRAIQKLVDLGDDAVAAITKTLLSSANENIRAEGTFILGRIGTTASQNALYKTFEDSGAIVRTAAARMVGLAKDTKAVQTLQKLLFAPGLAVRRQAAIALEQIGDTNAVTSLLKASSLANDRYAAHSIIHALIMLRTPAPLIAALNDTSLSTRKAALIALDQMDDSPLRREHVTAFLQSDEPEMVNTGMWVISHHKDWTDVVEEFVVKRSNEGTMSKQAMELLTQFSAQPRIQQFIATQLSSQQLPASQKVFYLNIIANAPTRTVPPLWVGAIRKLLTDTSESLVAKSLSVIEARSIKALSPQVRQIVVNSGASPQLKLNALAASVSADPLLTKKEFDVLMLFLGNNQHPPVRQKASRILSTAELTSEQLNKVAENIPTMDGYLLPLVVSSFEGNMNAATGKAFVTSLGSVADKLDNVSEDELKKALKDYPASVRKLADPIMSTLKQKNAARLAQLQSTEASLKKGDIGNGRALFFGKATCSTCHAINNEGSTFAPDLTNIGQIRSRHDILEAIMYPGASFAREHETSKIVTKSNTYTGIIKEQLSDAIVVAAGPGAIIRIPRGEINSIETLNTSLMPAGLDKQLNSQELSDLIAYLVSLPDGASGTIGY